LLLTAADDDMETMSQRYLSAAIKLERPPNHCVVFSACPTSITAAHNCTMRAVALLGTHKAFDLKNADLTCANMRELTVYNIRCVLSIGLAACRGGLGQAAAVRQTQQGLGCQRSGQTEAVMLRSISLVVPPLLRPGVCLAGVCLQTAATSTWTCGGCCQGP
jgi:hypothetical protein